MDRKLAAILSADVAGFSRLAALDEEGTIHALNLCLSQIGDIVREHDGRIFGTSGDGFVAEFASAVQATRCAVEIQRRLSGNPEDTLQDRGLEFRIGVNLGDVIVSGDDLLGDGVNIAARLQAMAPPSGICISGSVREHLYGKVPFALTSLGERELKNIPRPISVFRVDWRQEAPEKADAGPAPSPGDRFGRDEPSIVVMPFDNLSGQGDEYFVDGVVEEITAALSRVREFFVIARQSAFTYKGRFVDVRDVGKEFGVNYVVQGTVRRGGDRLRISVQLVDAETRTQFWSERYEGAAEDIFELQDRIAAQVAGAIHPAIRSAEIELSMCKPPNSLRAYDLVMRAYPYLWGQSKATNERAIPLLQDAIAIDPAYGRAHAFLAWCYAQHLGYIWTEEPERYLELVLRSVEAAAGRIDDDPTALTAVGGALSHCGDQERAAAYLERALALDPNNAWAWARYGWVASYKGETGATERFERALMLSPADPLAFNMRMGMALSLAMAGSLSEAVAIAREVINKHPDVTWPYRMTAAWAAMNGDLETARWAARKLMQIEPNFTIERYLARPVFQGVPEWAARTAEGLRQAGLPQR
ncbi:TolB-like protein/class 3 adenylate cyclase [Rhizobium sp. BK529]|uniref:adenylate/guanylate cyclase domain-containing protein n=1 Tax=unclassified Rhizobium TaxID=2613769 RepID=UPI0010CE1103|nr:MULTISPECIES: adenylate/guanylate cyclase domain-containing protein [unclassified Rhizobium]MBB3590535.1 TolB-like protein/class 3 adenylate cyclase [Rhizobium sp. BK529]TCS05224.1 TolB-like protein [Rhizobium sp. BK418]